MRSAYNDECEWNCSIKIPLGICESECQVQVTKLPFVELWDEKGTLTGGRIRPPARAILPNSCGAGPVQFEMADCGANLKWIPMQERSAFWNTIQAQIADHDLHQPIRLEQFPKDTANIASQWCGRAGECVVLLEKHH